MMTTTFEVELIFRIAMAGICGALIGYERMNRLKEAGIRTHTVVALGSALIMVVSKYGFMDTYEAFGTLNDPGRIAAQIVTGVGFLGAGMILVKKQTVSGLTTAAIIWTTSGIGMSIGSGLYLIGVASTLLLLIFQLLFHSKFMRKIEKTGETILIEMTTESTSEILDVFRIHKIAVTSFKVTKGDNHITEIELTISRSNDLPSAISDLTKIPSVKTIEH